MGQSSSNRRRSDHNNYPHPPNPSPHSYPYPPPNPQIYAPPPPPNPQYYPPPPPPPTSYATNPIDHGMTTLVRALDSLMGRVAYTHQYPPQYHYGPAPHYAAASSSASAAAGAATTRQQMPQFVEQQKAKTVKNDVNVHKDTIRLEVDERNPDRHLVSFVFDAVADGSDRETDIPESEAARLSGSRSYAGSVEGPQDRIVKSYRRIDHKCQLEILTTMGGRAMRLVAAASLISEFVSCLVWLFLRRLNAPSIKRKKSSPSYSTRLLENFVP